MTANTAAAAAREDRICAALGRGTSAERRLGAMVAASVPENAPAGRKSVPADLAAFVAGLSVREAADALGLSRGTVGRLRAGYWPRRAGAILDRWAAYQAAHGVVDGGWFIRRVYAPGIVRHARGLYAAPRLRAHVGKCIACTRAAGGALLAQTLELPAERFTLAAA